MKVEAGDEKPVFGNRRSGLSPFVLRGDLRLQRRLKARRFTGGRTFPQAPKLLTQKAHFFPHLAKLGVHLGLNVNPRLVRCLACGRSFLVAVALHGIDDNGDKEIEHGERGYQNEYDEKYPGIRNVFHDRPCNTHRPTFQRHDLEEGIE